MHRLLFLFFFVFSYGVENLIKSIEITGNSIVDKSEIENSIKKIIIGNEYNPANEDRILNILLGKKFVNKVDLKVKKNVLMVKIDEVKFIKDIIIPNIIPRQAAKQIKKQLKYKCFLKDKDIHLNNTMMYRALMSSPFNYEISSHLEQLVDEKNHPVQNHYNIVYKIKKTGIEYIDKIRIFNNNKISKSQIMLLLDNLQQGIIKKTLSVIPLRLVEKFTSKPMFNSEVLKQSINSIINFYKSKGFYSIRVTPYIIRKSESDAVDINLDIQEGRQMKIGRISILNKTSIEIQKHIIDRITKYKNYTASINNIDGIKKILLEYVQKNGFRHIAVDDKVLISKDKININITLKPESRNYIKDIDISGNNTVQANTIIKSLPVTPGEVLLPSDIAKIHSEIMRLGLFENVMVNMSNNILFIKVIEKKAFKEVFGMELNGGNPSMKLGFTDINTDGEGSQSSFKFNVDLSKGGSLGYRYMFNINNNISLSFFMNCTATDVLNISMDKNGLYMKSHLYNQFYKLSNKNHKKTENFILQSIDNVYNKRYIEFAKEKEQYFGNQYKDQSFDFYTLDRKKHTWTYNEMKKDYAYIMQAVYFDKSNDYSVEEIHNNLTTDKGRKLFNDIILSDSSDPGSIKDSITGLSKNEERLQRIELDEVMGKAISADDKEFKQKILKSNTPEIDFKDLISDSVQGDSAAVDRLMLMVGAEMNFRISDHLFFKVSPVVRYNYNMIKNLTSKFFYRKDDLFASIYGSTMFDFCLDFMRYKNGMPNGFRVNLTAEPIKELINNKTFNMKFGIRNTFHFAISNSAYISNITSLDYVHSFLSEDRIPYNNLFQLNNNLFGFGQAGGYDKIIKSSLGGNIKALNILGFNKLIELPNLVLLVNKFIFTPFIAVGWLNNTKFTPKDKIIEANNEIYASCGVNLTISTILAPFCITLAIDIINPARSNLEAFQAFSVVPGSGVV